jgi:GT2 family glycosyltransferase
VGTASGANQHYIFDCIQSALDTTRGAPLALSITAVDNSPGSGLGRRLRERFPGVHVRENVATLGFAANHNAALREAGAEYVMVSNDDVIYLPGAIERAVRYLGDPAHAKVGAVGLQRLNPDRSIQPSTYSFPTVPRFLLDVSGLRGWIPFAPWAYRLARWLGRGEGRSRFWAHDRTLPVQTLGGAAMLVRRAAFCDVGPMDEVSLIGGEETEWHKRLWDAGWSVVFLHDAAVVHFGSQTIRHLPRSQTEFFKGALNYFWKHRARPVYYAACWLALPALLLRMVPHLLVSHREEVRVLKGTLRVGIEWALRGPAGGDGAG